MAPMIRNIGALLVKGVPPRDIFTQHMAKYTSPTKGKDGTSHFGDLENLHIVSPTSILGDLIPALTAVAMTGRYLGQKTLAMTLTGDAGAHIEIHRGGHRPCARLPDRQESRRSRPCPRKPHPQRSQTFPPPGPRPARPRRLRPGRTARVLGKARSLRPLRKIPDRRK